MTSRLLAALWVALLMLSASTTAAFADGTVERSPIAAEFFTFDALNGGTVGDPIDVDALEAKIRAAEEEHEQTISTSAAQAERLDSINAFTDLGRNAATALITDVFAEALGLLTTLPSDPLLSSESPPEFVPDSDTSAWIDPPGAEESQLVVSSLPLRNEGGQVISGKLKANLDGFTPDAPLANVELPADADGAVALPDVDVEFTFADVNGSTGQLVDAGDAPGKEMVLYTNTQTDTDTAVTYTLQGIETFNFLRSAESPESLSLDYDLPDGAELQTTADGGAIVLDSEGESLVTVFPPFAVDAQGTSVPMTLAVDGNSIILSVPHRDENFAYPIMVDPVQHVRNWWTNGSSDNFLGWTFHQDGTSNYASSLSCPPALASVDPCGGTGAGVYVSAVPGKNYPANSKGYWRWTAPGGSSTSIVNAVLDSWRYRKGNQNAGWAFYNIYNTSNATSSGVNFTAGDGGSNLWLYGGNLGWKYLHSGLMTNTANTIPSGASNYRYNRIAAYTATLTDGENPTLNDPNTSGIPTGWIKENTTFTATASATDINGLGVQGIKAWEGGQWVWKSLEGCTGTWGALCPQFAPTRPLTFNSNTFPQGVNDIAVAAHDAGGKQSQLKQIRVKIDKTSPTVAISGNLTQYPSVRKDLPYYDLRIDAADGTAASPQSGIVEVKVKIDGQVVETYQQTCPTHSCDADGTWRLNASDYSTGLHLLQVEAKDAVGHVTSKPALFSLESDEVAPELDVSGPYTQAGSSPIGANEDLIVSATDVGYGVREIEVLNGDDTIDRVEQNCFDGDCKLEEIFTLELHDLEPRPTELTVVARDGAGNETSESLEFVLDPTSPEIKLTGDLVDLNGAPVTETVDQLKIVASDEANSTDTGIVRLTVTLENTVVLQVEPDCDESCPATIVRNYQYIPDLDVEGPFELEIEAVDASGNATTEYLVIDQRNVGNELLCDVDDPEMVPGGTAVDHEAAIDSVEETLPGILQDNDVVELEDDEIVDPTIDDEAFEVGVSEINGGLTEGAVGDGEVPSVELGDVICIAPSETTDDAAPAEAVNDSTLIYPNTNTDTDTVVRGTAKGVIIVENIRSDAAPSTFVWNYRVGDETALVALPNGAIAIVNTEDDNFDEVDDYDPHYTDFEWLSDVGAQISDSDQQLVSAQTWSSTLYVDAVISAPTAIDASGRTIPVTLSVDSESNQITLQLNPPAGVSVNYPVTMTARASSKPNMRNCRVGKSPCGSFKKARAVKYAKKYANIEKRRNPKFPSFGANDCTNFMSQVLRAGKMKFMRNFEKGQGSWWIRKKKGIIHIPPNSAWEYTRSWSLAHVLVNHLWEYGKTNRMLSNQSIMSANNGPNWRVGDIIAYKWGGSSEYGHLQFVTRRRNGGPHLAQHSGEDYFSRKWTRVRDDIKRWDKNATFTVFRIANRDANVNERKRSFGGA